ncbi:MAG: PAS domain-containing protein [Chthoniobacterales bacterium]|jgi:two-component system phosphate regulon sensor histidine kinase PhoR|nr:PAS domain-containing protein [Chthoniobacterales bacterium]
MSWLIIAILIACVMLVVWLRVRRRWIKPWEELEQLVTAIVERKAPRKFLITANDRANALGLALEKFALKQGELEIAATQGSKSLQSILGALPDGLALVDHQRRLQVMNPRFRELFGLRDDAMGAGLLEIVRDAVVDRSVAAALERGELQTEPMTLARGLESRRELEVTVVPFNAGNNGTSNAVVLFRDMTQVRQVEEMRRDFVANVSHELRTPLSIFRGYLETLLDDPMQPREELVRILEVMDRHADRLTLLVEDILSLAKLETPGARLELTEIYLPDFLGGILRDWEKRLGAKLLHASLEAPEDLPVVAADEHRLQEVIYNLLDNAVKYSQPEGKVRLQAQRIDASVRISVSDEGVGIPARDLPRVFERFYRADKARSRQLGGTGLGLSIVKHIAQLHGGSVEAASEPGRGTTIAIVLPVRPPMELEQARDIAQPQFHF